MSIEKRENDKISLIGFQTALREALQEVKETKPQKKGITFCAGVSMSVFEVDRTALELIPSSFGAIANSKKSDNCYINSNYALESLAAERTSGSLVEEIQGTSGPLVEEILSPNLILQKYEKSEGGVYFFYINIDPNVSSEGVYNIRIIMAYIGTDLEAMAKLTDSLVDSDFCQYLNNKRLILPSVCSFLDTEALEYSKELENHKNLRSIKGMLQQLKNKGILNQENTNTVITHQYPLDLASVLASLTQANLLNEPNFEFVKKHDNLFDLASVLASLTQTNLLNEPNFEFVKKHDNLSDLASVLVRLGKERLLTQANFNVVVAHKNPHEFAKQKISNNKKIKVALAGFFAGAGIMATTLISSPATVHYLSGLVTFMPQIATLVAAVTISAIAMALLALFVNALINVFQKANPVPQELCPSP